MKTWRLVLAGGALWAMMTAAQAQDQDREYQEDPAEQLKDTQSTLEEAKAKRQRVAEQAGKLAGELTSLQKELAAMAGRLQANEAQLTQLEVDNQAHAEKIKRAEAALARREAQHGQVTESLVRLSTMPPEAILLSPGGTKNAFVTETALAQFMKDLRRDAEELKIQLTELQALKKESAQKQVEILSEKQALQQSRVKLDGKIRERGTLLKAASQDNQALAAQINTLSKQSKDLKEFLEKLEASRKAAEEKRRAEAEAAAAEAEKQGRKAPPPRRSASSSMRSIVDAKGHLRMPASGRITAAPEGIGGKDGQGPGIAIASREFAQVISPFDGEVVYAGTFRGYGNMLIIRHTDGYHSLIAGLEKIDCVPGQMVVEGEPVGAMGGGNARRVLYLEFREHGKPIDPKPWLANTNKS